MSAAAREPLREGYLRAHLVGPDRFWRCLDVVAETGSTNADLIARDAAGQSAAGAVLLAEQQSAGRGRNGRTWDGVPRAQILMSFGVSAADVPVDGWGWLPLLTGVAVVDTVAELTGVRAELKWPNDVLVGDRKLAGILAEVAPSRVIVVGIGLNVTLDPAELAGDAGVVATSLHAEGVDTPDREAIVRRLLERLADRLMRWQVAGGADDALVDDYRARSGTLGAPVRVMLPGDEVLTGTAASVDRRGRLLIDTGGQSVSVSAGDIVHLRKGV